MRTQTKSPCPDVLVENHGNVFALTLLTKQARAWVEENLEVESWQWTGENTLCVDHHYIEQIVHMMQDPEQEGPGLVVGA